MRALVIDAKGSADQLREAEMPIPMPGPAEVLIRVASAGVNPADWKIVERGWPTWTFPVVAGLDGAGLVEAVGEGVTGLAHGDRVYWHGRFARLGAYAERALIDADLVVRLPDAVSFVAGAALPTAAFTAYQITEIRTNAQPGDMAIVNAAAGGVGLYAMQLLKRRGVRVLAVASRSNHDFVRDYGADEVADYRDPGFPENLRAQTGGRGADVIIDPMGPASAAAMIPLLAYGGHLLCVTGIPGPQGMAAFPRGASLHDIALGWAYISGDPRALQQVRRVAEAVGVLAASGDLRVPVEQRITLSDLPAALAASKAGHQRGRVVAVIDPALAEL